MDPGKENTGQNTEGTQPTPPQGQPTDESNPDKENTGQNSQGAQPAPPQGQPIESSPGKENTGQSSEGTQPAPQQEQPIDSTPGTGQITEETEPVPKEEEPKNGQGTDQISEGTEPVPKEEEPTNGQEKDLGEASANKEGVDKILELLEQIGNEQAVVLTGDAGVGKTWLAREVTKSAIGAKGPFYMSLWISLTQRDQKNKDYQSVYQSIALQLSIPTIAGVWEDVDDFDDWKIEEYAESLQQLQPKVTEKLEEKMNHMREKYGETEKTFLLLVLDSEADINTGDYNHIMNELFLGEGVKGKLGGPFSIKVLITTRNINENFILDKKLKRVVEIQPLSGGEAVSFFPGESVGDEDPGLSNFHNFCNAIKKRNKVLPVDKVSGPSKVDKFCDAIKKRSKVLPAQMIMLAEALKRIAKDDDPLERAFDAALDILNHAKEDDPRPLLHFTYEKLPDNCIVNCFWHSWNLMREHGGVQYNELIAHWILEGHLDLAAGVKTAYEKGYQVMMELIDRGMLKMQEDNLIALERATDDLEEQDHSCRGLFETSNLGLGSMLEGDGCRVFERMAPADGMMKTASVYMKEADKKEADKKKKSVSSLLIDGSRLCREVPDAFFEAKQELKVLALFYPRFTSLPAPISKMENLLVFVLRDCSLLNDIDCIQNLKALKVLEVSGSPFLKKMQDDFFQKMAQLRSLNLSGLGIESLPPSLSNLTELRRLILRKCPFLEALPKLAKLKQLEVIDLSGSSSLKKIQEKSFKSLQELRFLDFSETKIEKLPIVQTLEHLRILLVRECDHLYGLRSMKHLPNLRVYNVSGATRIKEIYYDCFDDTKDFRILDLSRTEIGFLPDSLGEHLCHLKLKACPKLVKLLKTEHLKHLESLDLSDSSGLEKFPDNFFDHLTSLQSLNLSNTKVETLPSLSKLLNLRRLFLKDCSLESLPDLTVFTHLVELDLSNCKSKAHKLSLAGLEHLEIINLSGYKALSEIDATFERMSWLQVLNLSETQISSLPPLCDQPSRLRSLILMNCTNLQSPPKFEILTRLEELDLRGTTALKDAKAESLNPLTKLRTLRLSKTADASIEALLPIKLEKLEVLDISEKDVTSLPSLEGLSSLRELLLSGCSSLKELPPLNSLSHLEVLDLSGTKVGKLGEKISNLTHLKRLHLPEEVIEEVKNGEYIKFLPLELKLDRSCISKLSDVPVGGEKFKINVHGTEFFKSLKEKSEENSAVLERIKHSISSIHSESKCEDNYGNSRKHIFTDVYSKFRKLPTEPKDGQSLEIRGFDEFPVDIDVVLERAEHVYLVENNFLKNLSDIKPSLKSIRGFWIESCTRMETIFMEADLVKWENLEILWISNLPKLKSLHDEKVQSSSLKNLKKLYIDCCPMLETVFSSGQIPEKLETLQITFCDKLKTLVGEKGSANSEVPTPSSTSKEVKTRDKKMEAQLKSSADKGGLAQTMQTNREVPTASSTSKEVKTKDKETEARAVSSTDKKMQEQNTSLANKGGQAQTTQTTSITNLKYLHIFNCPMLETLFSSEQLPTNLEILQIKFCDSLKSLSRQELLNPEVPNLQTSQPLELPNQTSSSTGLKSSKSIPKDAEVPNIHEESSQQGDAAEEITKDEN